METFARGLACSVTRAYLDAKSVRFPTKSTVHDRQRRVRDPHGQDAVYEIDNAQQMRTKAIIYEQRLNGIDNQRKSKNR
jgi:hypothetical protein